MRERDRGRVRNRFRRTALYGSSSRFRFLMKKMVFEESEGFCIWPAVIYYLSTSVSPGKRLYLEVSIISFSLDCLYLASVTGSGRQKLFAHTARFTVLRSHDHLCVGWLRHPKREACPGKCTASYVASVNVSLCVYLRKMQVFQRNLLFNNVLS